MWNLFSFKEVASSFYIFEACSSQKSFDWPKVALLRCSRPSLGVPQDLLLSSSQLKQSQADLSQKGRMSPVQGLLLMLMGSSPCTSLS